MSYSLVFEVRDGHGNFIGEIGDVVDSSVAFSSDASDVDSSSFSLSIYSPWARSMMKANRTLVLVHILIHRDDKLIKTWTGRVDRSVRKTENGEGSVNVELVSDKTFLKHIMAYSAPGAGLWLQAPKERIYNGPALHTAKRILSDNLLRLSDDLKVLTGSKWLDRPNEWANAPTRTHPFAIVPTHIDDDRTPRTSFQVAMTPMDEVWQEVCKDYNLLPTAHFYVPGRDPVPDHIRPTRPCVIFDIQDMDYARARKETHSQWRARFERVGETIRGLFGMFDTPQDIDTTSAEDLKAYFGTREDDPWVIFRQSELHVNEIEVASYAPTAIKTISGGKTQSFLNDGVQLIFNLLMNGAMAAIGLGFAGLDVGGTFDDILLAYQAADDSSMKEWLGDFVYPEEFIGSGTTAYSFDAAQGIRQARNAAVGYTTAMFSGDIAAFLPFRVFEDFDLLSPVAFEDPYDERLVAERIKAITMSYSRSEGVSLQIRLGESERPEEPTAVAERRHERTIRALNTIMRRD